MTPRAILFGLLASILLVAACGEDDHGTAAEDPVGGDTVDVSLPPDEVSDPTGGNHPPELFKIGDKVVAVNETLTIELSAFDEDGDTLTYSVYGDIPDGASFLKAEHRFVWTPLVPNQSVFLTFVVSDGAAFDRETIQIQTVTSKTQSPPVFEQVGDQLVAAGEEVRLQLEATDVDGDPLTFSMEGSIPPGASFDAPAALFVWTPSADHAGQVFRVHFVVSDGFLSDDMEVTFIVDGGEGTNHPPTIGPFAPLQVEVGDAVVIEVEAVDPDGDPLTLGVDGSSPAGATFDADSGVFSWTPSAAQADKVFAVTFSASDEQYTVYATVELTVGEVGSTISCEDDQLEPNNTIDAATTLPPGSYEGLSICDTELSPVDADWFAISMDEPGKLEVVILFEHDAGDIDLALFDASGSGDPVSWSYSLSDMESLEYQSDGGETLYLAAYGTAGSNFSNVYDMEISIAEATTCTDDGAEDNDTEASAEPLSMDTLLAGVDDLAICPGDEDWYSFSLDCGDDVTLLVEFTHADGNLDAFVLDDTGAIVASGQGSGDGELMSFEVAHGGTHYLRVVGTPPASTANSYWLLTEISEAPPCDADSLEPNDSASSATEVPGEVELGPLTSCCGDEDWFELSLGAGDEVLAQVTVYDGAVAMRLVDPQGDEETSGLDVDHIAATSGTYHLVVTPVTSPASYGLSLLVAEGTGGCTPKSCPVYQVCDASAGECVYDYCTVDGDCPTGLPCIDTYCVDPCTAETDCRDGYTCKVFPNGQFCGIEGSKGVGSPCSYFSECEGAQACITIDGSGVCAMACATDADCPTGLYCDGGCLP